MTGRLPIHVRLDAAGRVVTYANRPFASATQVVEADPEEVARGYVKDGAFRIAPPSPGADHVFDTLSEAWVYSPAPVTAERVNAARARRIAAGVDLTIEGLAAPVALQGRPEDRENLSGLAILAQLRVAAGDTTTPTTYRDRENADHTLTPPQVLALYAAAMAWVEAVYAASWAIKGADPIPQDFDDDSRWP